MLEQRPPGRVHAAVEHGIRALALDLGQDRFPVGRLVRALLARQNLDVGGLQRLLDLIGDALAVCGRVVDHRHEFGLLVLREVARDRRALLVIAADHAELCLESLLGQLRVRCRARDHGDAGLAVDRGSRNRRARVEVADDAVDFCIDQLLRNRRADLRIGLIVFGDEREFHVLAIDLDLRGIRFLDRQAGAVLVVLAEVRDAAGQRADVADLHFHRGRGLRRSRRGGNDNLFLGLLLFLAAAGDAGSDRSSNERQCKLRAFHASSTIEFRATGRKRT